MTNIKLKKRRNKESKNVGDILWIIEKQRHIPQMLQVEFKKTNYISVKRKAQMKQKNKFAKAKLMNE